MRSIRDCRAAVAAERGRGERIGLVPTMGALHEGHLSLVDLAREAAERVVVSIFVNPLQFGPGEDYEAYPRDLERDLALVAGRGAHLVFAPEARAIYPSPPATRVTMGGPTDRFEGVARPGHFEGVLTIVAKLFHIVEPDLAVFGQKDAQQAAAVRLMVADLDFPVEIVVGPTVREEDGLACSSRNAYLSEAERRKAPALYHALVRGRERARAGESDPARVSAAIEESLAETPGLEVEYAAIVDPATFEPTARIGPGSLAIVAARLRRTRLIDNLVLLADD